MRAKGAARSDAIGHRLLIVLLFLWPVFLFSQHENQRYLPLTANELGPPVTLKRLTRLESTSPDLRAGAGPSGSTYRVRFGKGIGLLTLQGQDKLHKPWHVELLPLWGCTGGTEDYDADLDKDGILDAVLLMPTCGNGLAPSVHLITVTFDTNSRPIPFEAEGYLEDKARGLDSLVDLNRDESAPGCWNHCGLDGRPTSRERGRPCVRGIRASGRLSGDGSRRYVLHLAHRIFGSSISRNSFWRTTGWTAAAADCYFDSRRFLRIRRAVSSYIVSRGPIDTIEGMSLSRR